MIEDIIKRKKRGRMAFIIKKCTFKTENNISCENNALSNQRYCLDHLICHFNDKIYKIKKKCWYKESNLVCFNEADENESYCKMHLNLKKPILEFKLFNLKISIMRNK